jgi:hypothetical protein
MLEYLAYITLFCVIVVSITYLYIKAKFGFWMIQPVFHVYDIGYMISAPGIINHGLPVPNKYTNFKNIDTVVYADLSDFKINKFAKFIQTNYLNYKANIFSPKIENISPYFYGHGSKSFISFYNEDNLLTDLKNGTTINEPKIIGVITGRPMHVVINTNESKGNDNDAKFDVYYIDYLCVDKSYRKKGIAPEVIQTHYYNQSHINQNITVNLFKREDELTGIVPLCVYSTYGFSVNTWTKPVDLLPMYKLVEINAHNFHLLFSFIQDNSSQFDILIYSEITNLVELLKTKNVFIYTIVVQNEIVCAYFFRKSCVFVDKDLEVLSCFASINNYHEDSNDIFIRGFKISFWKIAEANKFGYSAIENISHNNVIIDNLCIKTKPLIVSPTAYFFYNFAYRTFSSTKVLIIN